MRRCRWTNMTTLAVQRERDALMVRVLFRIAACGQYRYNDSPAVCDSDDSHPFALFISGDGPQLGNWNVDNAMRLEQVEDMPGHSKWTGSMELDGLQAASGLKYRLMCGSLLSDGKIVTNIWETTPRVLTPEELDIGGDVDVDITFGSEEVESAMDTVDFGWTRNCIQVRFYDIEVTPTDADLDFQVTARAVRYRKPQKAHAEPLTLLRQVPRLCHQGTAILPRIPAQFVFEVDDLDSFQCQIDMVNFDEHGVRERDHDDDDNMVHDDDNEALQNAVDVLPTSRLLGSRMLRVLSVTDAEETDDAQVRVPTNASRTDPYVGRVVITPPVIRSLRGQLEMPFISCDGQVCGLLQCHFMVILPYDHPKCTLEHAWRKVWRDSPDVPLNIGHRGFGRSHASANADAHSVSSIAENTILSFQQASRFGMDYVEFDVQLSADQKVVVFHNFFLPLDIRSSKWTSDITHAVLIRDLRWSQLQHLAPQKPAISPRRFTAHVKKNVSLPRNISHDVDIDSGAAAVAVPKRKQAKADGGNLSDPEQDTASIASSQSDDDSTSGSTSSHRGSSDIERASPLKVPKMRGLSMATSHTLLGPSTSPTGSIVERIALLKEVLLKTPDTLGLNIEVKYPVERIFRSDDERRNFEEAFKLVPNVNRIANTYFERNLVVDAILNVVFEYARPERRIYFSCFDPDVCILLHKKQPRYPVFFLTEAGQYDEFGVPADIRCRSLRRAVRFALRAGLAGIVSHCHPLIHKIDLIKEVKSLGLRLISWGEPNNKAKYVELQKEHGIDGVILDNVGDLSRREKKGLHSDSGRSDHRRSKV